MNNAPADNNNNNSPERMELKKLENFCERRIGQGIKEAAAGGIGLLLFLMYALPRYTLQTDPTKYPGLQESIPAASVGFAVFYAIVDGFCRVVSAYDMYERGQQILLHRSAQLQADIAKASIFKQDAAISAAANTAVRKNPALDGQTAESSKKFS